MIKLLKYLDKKSWIFLLIILVFVIAQVYSDLQLPGLLTNIINNSSYAEYYNSIGDPNNLVAGFKDEIINNFLQMLGYILISLVSQLVVCFFAAKISADFSYTLRKKVYEHIQTFSLAEMDKFQTSSLITRTTNDINQIQQVVVMILRMALAAPITAIYGIIKASDIQSNFTLSMIVVVAVIALCLLVVILFILVLPKFNKIQKLTDRLNGVTRENLTGIRVIRAYAAEEYQTNKFQEVNAAVTSNNTFVNRVLSVMSPGMMLIMNSTSLAIVWIGSYFINDGTLLIGSVFGFQQITMQIVMAFLQLIMIFIMVPRGVVSAKRINDVLSLNPSIVNDINGTKITSIDKIEFKNVNFSYAGGESNTLDNISFTISKGMTFAVIGSTGSGKTTLVNLIERLYDATNGEVLINDINIKNIELTSLRDKIGYVAQKALLFKGTIKSNLLLVNENLTNDEIIDALKVSQAYDFVSNLDNSIDSLVSQGGKNFSGGQKQRLSIARAVVKKPDLFIFDDSFSALDFKTDKELRKALNNLDYNPTKIIVAQRVGTIIDADMIVVLDDGKIVGMGKHNELLNSCSVYQEIVYSQISKEEAHHE